MACCCFLASVVYSLLAFTKTGQLQEPGSVELTLESTALIHSLHVECDGYAADDLHFHMAPQSRRTLRFRPLDAAPRKFKAHLGALNLRELVTVRAD